MLDERDRLIALLNEAHQRENVIGTEDTADYLLNHGISVPVHIETKIETAKDRLIKLYDMVFWECNFMNCYLCDYQNQYQHCMAAKFIDKMIEQEMEGEVK